MSSEYTSQVTVSLLLLILLSVLTIGMLLMVVVLRYLEHRRLLQRKKSAERELELELEGAAPRYHPFFESPCRWVVIRSANPLAAQSVLGLHNARSCSWGEGLARLNDHTLFISPPIDGWLLLVGAGLPDPSEDVDECYRFVLALSREMGHVQFFSFNRVVDHHAWVKAEGNRILRAYAWGGETLWNQGRMSPAEAELGMQCFGYGQGPHGPDLAAGAGVSNADKVPLLAARWSFDPTIVDERRIPRGQGITGHLTSFKQH